MDKMINCKTCQGEIAADAKTCPKCGARNKQKMGFIKKAFIAFVVLIIIGATLGRGEKNEKREKLANTPAETKYSGADTVSLLADYFNPMSKHTDIQREQALQELKGKVVEWELVVFEVSKQSSAVYKIQTSSRKNYVGTFVSIHSPGAEDVKTLAALKTGDKITVKGYVDGSFMRNINLNPAMLVKK